MIARLLLLGATGDLAGRFLLPALAGMHAEGRLPPDFAVLGASDEDAWDDGAFRDFAAARLRRHAAGVPAASRDALVGRLRYRPVDVTDRGSVAELLRLGPGAEKPLVAYLALPQRLSSATVTALAGAELPAGSRVALEKPFGEDLESAVALNELVARSFGEAAAFRVDHALGLPAAQDLLARRRDDRRLGAAWDGEHIEEVEILWEETLALEGRAAFYDRAGALKDVLQNHMLQLLSLVAMEPPSGAGDLAERRLDALRAVRSLTPEEVPRRSRRARYTAGGDVPSYVDEDGVDGGRDTETFAEVLLELDTPRWRGTRFRLRAGKALARRRKGVIVRFRPPGEELRFGFENPDEIAELPAYTRVLLDLLSGGSALSVGGEEAEEAWRIVTPVLRAWADGSVPMAEYAAGSDGAPPLAA